MAKKHTGLSFYQKEKSLSNEKISGILSWVFVFLLAVFLSYVFVTALGMRVNVPGNSMEPSLYNGQVIFIDRVIYSLTAPKYGDVIVFKPNGNQNSISYVKRVVAVPGDTVEIKNGMFYRNGEPEDLFSDRIADAGLASEKLTMGVDEFFVMGDNANSSEDSRSANIGNVLREHIEGKAWFHMAGGSSGIGRVHSHAR